MPGSRRAPEEGRSGPRGLAAYPGCTPCHLQQLQVTRFLRAHWSQRQGLARPRTMVCCICWQLWGLSCHRPPPHPALSGTPTPTPGAEGAVAGAPGPDPSRSSPAASSRTSPHTDPGPSVWSACGPRAWGQSHQEPCPPPSSQAHPPSAHGDLQAVLGGGPQLLDVQPQRGALSVQQGGVAGHQGHGVPCPSHLGRARLL